MEFRGVGGLPELLAPAGSRAAFEAALAAGADAVYLGIDEGFNARRGAENFGLADLRAACREAHLRGRRVYLTANTLVMPGEMKHAFALVAAAAEAGIDAVIVQDVGLMSKLAREIPELRLHASTQMNIRDAAGIEFAARLGAQRVVLARELSLKQIKALAGLGMEVETFVHGALCVCQSGQCLFSSMIGGRSANRGMCAQPCRLPYELRRADGKKLNGAGEYLLSPKDLNTLEVLPELVAAGVASLKIEGRMKSADYVGAAVSSYRAALDQLAAGAGYQVTEQQQRDVAETFSRGFSAGYLRERDGDELMGYTRPNNRGVAIGRVAGFRDGHVRIRPTSPLAVGDILEFWTSKRRVTHEVSLADNLGGEVAELVVRGAVAPGDRVFRVRSAAVSDRMAQRTAAGLKIPVDFEVAARIGEPLIVRVTCGNVTAAAEGAVVEAARTKAITHEDVVEHVGRLGATNYVAASFTVDLDEGAGMGFSTLHKLRTQALEAWEEAAIAAYDEARAARPHTPQRIEYEQAKPYGKSAVFVSQLNYLEHGDVAHTIAEFERGKQIGPRLYATNTEALQVWATLGAELAWLSPELTLEQIRVLSQDAPLPLGLVVGGREELMVSDHCFLRAQGTCRHNCKSCERRREQVFLKDRKGYEFPVVTNAAGQGHIFNSVPLDLVHATLDLKRAGVTGFAINTTLMEPGEAERELDRVRAALNGKTIRKKQDATTGHLFRKVQ